MSSTWATPTPRTAAAQDAEAPDGHAEGLEVRQDDLSVAVDAVDDDQGSQRMARCRTVRTRSGSCYRLMGRRVHKDTAEGGEDYILVDTHGGRLRYTDGERLYISSPVVGVEQDPA
jgi:hypothetical protein